MELQQELQYHNESQEIIYGQQDEIYNSPLIEEGQ
jgi:hypothetical protein